MTALATLAADPRRVMLAVAAVAIATIAGAWAIEWWGWIPCKLCLQQRIPYYVVIPLALAGAWLAAAPERSGMVRIGLVVVGLVMLVSVGMGVFHAGVEWGWWQGPGDCGGRIQEAPRTAGDFFKSLDKAYVVRCTEAAFRVLGLSLAGWNAVISAGLAALALKAARG